MCAHIQKLTQPYIPHAVAYIVLSSRDHASYKKDSGALEDVLKNTFVYLEPKSDRMQH